MIHLLVRVDGSLARTRTIPFHCFEENFGMYLSSSKNTMTHLYFRSLLRPYAVENPGLAMGSINDLDITHAVGEVGILDSRTPKIASWPALTDQIQIRVFLGTVEMSRR